MPKLIFCSLVALLLVVSCECKDMHVRRMPDEKDIAFKGEAKTAKKTVSTYRKGQSRDIQVHLTSNDEEAKDAQFKILSATLADGSPADVDYDSLKLGYNTLSYTPKGPGTHEITLRVAVEGEGNVQIIPCTLEAPAAEWRVSGTADATGNLTIQIADVPEELQGEPWRITNTTWSEGLEGNMNTPTILQYGDNSFSLTLDQAVLSEPYVRLNIEGPDAITKTCQIDLIALCMMQLHSDMSNAEQLLVTRLERVTEYVQRTDSAYTLPPETVTDPRENRRKQEEIATLLGRLTAFQTGYEENMEAFSSNLETLEQTQVNEHLAVFEANNKRLKDAIASLKSAQVQLQQQCTSAHEALFKILENEEQEAIETLLEDPELDVNGPIGSYSLLQGVITKNRPDVVDILLQKNADVNYESFNGKTPLYIAAEYGNVEIIQFLLNAGAGADINREIQEGDFDTPLYVAAEYGNSDVVRVLLNVPNIDLEMCSARGYTALDIAKDNERADIIILLERAGAE